VILITGSGPQDRDETLLGHKPFLVIADALTRAGVAVLRLDDRGVGGSTGSLETATTVDLARDTAAAIDWLAHQPGIDPGRIGLIGHSEGGLIAPMLATTRKDVAFMALLAGPAQRGDALLLEQTGLLAGASGVDAAGVDALRRTLSSLIERAKDPAPSQAELQGALRGALLAAASELPQGIYAILDPYPVMLASPWMRAFLAYDPAPALEQVRCPTLALFGGRDLQVPAGSNEPLARAALAASGLGDRAVVRVVPGVNHLFQPCTTGGVAEYAQIETTIDPTTLRELVDWVVLVSTR
jgi:pimeloyl-ACP methyl ester carboxylesterase